MSDSMSARPGDGTLEKLANSGRYAVPRAWHPTTAIPCALAPSERAHKLDHLSSEPNSPSFNQRFPYLYC